MKTAVILTVSLYVLLAVFCLIGLVTQHSVKDVFTKKLLMYALGTMALAAGLGGAFARSESLVTVFYWLEALSFVLGVLHLIAARRLFPYLNEGGFGSELLLMTAVLFLIAGAFTGLFQFMQRSGSDRFLPALAAGLLPFMLPLLFLYAYTAWLAIPPKVYRKWFYPLDRAVPLIELNDTVRLNFKVAKAPDVSELATYTVKAPIDRTLHDLFHYMIYSHNAEENPDQPILYHEHNHEGSLLGWVFYKQSLGGLAKQFLDPSLTLMRNGIRANDVIIARSFVSVGALENG